MWDGEVCGGLRHYYIVSSNGKFDMAKEGNRNECTVKCGWIRENAINVCESFDFYREFDEKVRFPKEKYQHKDKVQ